MRSVVIVAALATRAFADGEPVRDDIVALRHERTPARLRFLGWTNDGRPVLHETDCGFQDNSDLPLTCVASLVVGATETTVMAVSPIECAHVPCETFPWRVSHAAASHAIRAEAFALATLGQLQASASKPMPKLGIVRRDCGIALTSHGRTIAPRTVIGRAMCISEGHDTSVHAATIADVHWSPDGHKLAVTVAITTMELDTFGELVQTFVIDAPAP